MCVCVHYTLRARNKLQVTAFRLYNDKVHSRQLSLNGIKRFIDLIYFWRFMHKASTGFDLLSAYVNKKELFYCVFILMVYTHDIIADILCWLNTVHKYH